jgi:hypothetical protein
MYILEEGFRYTERMSKCTPPGCLMNMLATMWVDMYYAAFHHTSDISQQNEEMHMSAIRVDLTSCIHRLTSRETELTEKIGLLTGQAKEKSIEK